MLGVNPVGAGIATSPCNSSTWLGREARKSNWFPSAIHMRHNKHLLVQTQHQILLRNGWRTGMLPGNAWVWRKWGRLFTSAPFAQSWEHPNPVVMLFSLICSIWQDKFWSKNRFTLWKHKLKPFLRQCTSWNLQCHVQIDDLIIWYSRISYRSRSAAPHDQPVFEDVQFPYFAASTRPHRRSHWLEGGPLVSDHASMLRDFCCQVQRQIFATMIDVHTFNIIYVMISLKTFFHLNIQIYTVYLFKSQNLSPVVFLPALPTTAGHQAASASAAVMGGGLGGFMGKGCSPTWGMIHEVPKFHRSSSPKQVSTMISCVESSKILKDDGCLNKSTRKHQNTTIFLFPSSKCCETQTRLEAHEAWGKRVSPLEMFS